MTRASFLTFAGKMVVLEKAFSVKHIATIGLTTVSPEDRAASLLSAYPLFDQFPVEVERRVVGVMKRKAGVGRGRVKNVMRCPDEADWMALLSEHRRLAVLKGQRRYYTG